MKKFLLNSITPSVLLIFLGYCHLHFFYVSQFDIDIYQFVSASEIILSFLPVTFQLFFLILPFIFIVLVHYSDKRGKVRKKNSKNIFAGYSFHAYRKVFFRKTSKEKLFLFYKMITHYQILLFAGWCFLTFLIFRNGLYKDEVIATMLFPIWTVLFLLGIRKGLHLGIGFFFKRDYKIIYWTGAFIFVFMLVDFLNAFFEAENIKHGIHRKAVKFEYEKKKINTFKDESISFIGATQQYLFIYDRYREHSHVYDKSKVTNMVTGEIPHFDKEKMGKLVDTVLTTVFVSVCDSLKAHHYSKEDSIKLRGWLSTCDSLAKYQKKRLTTKRIDRDSLY